MKKRWRAWLRAIHRDFGYLAIGFTLIYAISGIAQNHIEDWGDVSFKTTERTLAIATIPDTTPEIVAVKTVADAAGLGTPTGHTRAGDEIRLDYANLSKVTAIVAPAGTAVTIQTRSRRPFIGLANWLHTARHKKAWKYISDTYAVLLLYLALSGIFMIKGTLGLKWRGTILISTGIAVPVLYVALAGGPNSQHDAVAGTETALHSVPVDLGPPKVAPSPAPSPRSPAPSSAPSSDPSPDPSPAKVQGAGSAVLVPLPPDDDN
ncbi:MAG: PepSY-associated TM helix domain-containing protein [Kofleriaceae bacterium]